VESSRELTSPRATCRPRVPPAYGRIGASAVDLHLRGRAARPQAPCTASIRAPDQQAAGPTAPRASTDHVALRITRMQWPAGSRPRRTPRPQLRLERRRLGKHSPSRLLPFFLPTRHRVPAPPLSIAALLSSQLPRVQPAPTGPLPFLL
jgi:hypothetical protein